MRVVSILILTALTIPTGCSGIMERRFVSQIQDRPAPDFELTSLDGQKIRLADFRGKSVVLSFWAYG
jgi:cytochrome oxidase Cu insertion factor (SCO1/SenC/PrrC family)